LARFSLSPFPPPCPQKQREEILKKLAHCCKDQGEYHLACKKYTQSGDHVRAMKCLLKSSDTEKICYYATMTKQREIYILAANFLQNLDWHNDPEIMKKIIDFYSKVRTEMITQTVARSCHLTSPFLFSSVALTLCNFVFA